MISKNQINKRIKNKTNTDLVETINLAKKNNLLELAKKLSKPSRIQTTINVEDLGKLESNKIIIAGKVLGNGEINKKISVSAISFSKEAKEKLKKAGCEFKTIKEEIKTNPKLNEIKII